MINRVRLGVNPYLIKDINQSLTLQTGCFPVHDNSPGTHNLTDSLCACQLLQLYKNPKRRENRDPTFTMRARILLITLVLLRPAPVAGLRGAWPLRPLGCRAIRNKRRRALMGLHYPNMICSCENLQVWGNGVTDTPSRGALQMMITRPRPENPDC